MCRSGLVSFVIIICLHCLLKITLVIIWVILGQMIIVAIVSCSSSAFCVVLLLFRLVNSWCTSTSASGAAWVVAWSRIILSSVCVVLWWIEAFVLLHWLEVFVLILRYWQQLDVSVPNVLIVLSFISHLSIIHSFKTYASVTCQFSILILTNPDWVLLETESVKKLHYFILSHRVGQSSHF